MLWQRDNLPIPVSLNSGKDRMEYDEIRITTRREISICVGAIRKLERCINGFEKKYRMTSADFLRDRDLSGVSAVEDLTQWRDGLLSLCRWKERLKDHRDIMKGF
jgi:hypothetical protein